MGDPNEDFWTYLYIYAGWTTPVTHIAPLCLNASYWKSQYGFRTFLDLDRLQIICQLNVIVRQYSSWCIKFAPDNKLNNRTTLRV